MMYPKNSHIALAALQRALRPEEVWQASNDLLRAVLPVFHVLMGLPCLGPRPFFLRTTLPMPDTESYFAKLDAAAPMGDLLVRNPGALTIRLSDQLPPGPLDGMPFYDQFMKPEGWRYSAALLFWSSSGDFIGQLALNRTEAQGDVTDAEMALLREFQPLVNAAVERLLAAEKQAAAHSSLEHIVHSLPLPMAGVNWDFGINYLNAAAREALASWRLGSRGSRTFKPDASEVLPADLRAVCEQLKVDWQQALITDKLTGFPRIRLLSHATEAGLQAAIQLIEPVPGRSLQPSFFIQFSLPSAGPHDAAWALAELAKLTTAEREVAGLAAAGQSNADIVRRLSVSESTVRTHLRNIFRKLGITSRGKLTPLYRSLDATETR